MPKKTFQHKNGEIKSYSNGVNKCNKLEQIELNITKEQLEKIESNNYNLFIKNKKLVLEERENLIQQKEIEQLINQVKEKYGDLIPLLEKIINIKGGKNYGMV